MVLKQRLEEAGSDDAIPALGGVALNVRVLEAQRPTLLTHKGDQSSEGEGGHVQGPYTDEQVAAILAAVPQMVPMNIQPEERKPMSSACVPSSICYCTPDVI
jgi:hypothetical protein